MRKKWLVVFNKNEKLQHLDELLEQMNSERTDSEPIPYEESDDQSVAVIGPPDLPQRLSDNPNIKVYPNSEFTDW
jgi:hypothetical protein